MKSITSFSLSNGGSPSRSSSLGSISRNIGNWCPYKVSSSVLLVSGETSKYIGRITFVVLMLKGQSRSRFESTFYINKEYDNEKVTNMLR